MTGASLGAPGRCLVEHPPQLFSHGGMSRREKSRRGPVHRAGRVGGLGTSLGGNPEAQAPLARWSADGLAVWHAGFGGPGHA